MPQRHLEERSLDKYFDSIRDLPLLTAEQERINGRLWQRDRNPEGLRMLVEGNLRFVVKEARKFQGMGLDLLDLISEGNLGLIEAAKRFDPERENKFLTYASWWVRQGHLPRPGRARQQDPAAPEGGRPPGAAEPHRPPPGPGPGAGADRAGHRRRQPLLRRRGGAAATAPADHLDRVHRAGDGRVGPDPGRQPRADHRALAHGHHGSGVVPGPGAPEPGACSTRRSAASSPCTSAWTARIP